MDVNALAGTFKNAGNQNFFSYQTLLADRTKAFAAAAAQTVGAAPDVHEPVFAAGHGGESEGIDSFSIVQLGGTYGTGFWLAWFGLGFCLCFKTAFFFFLREIIFPGFCFKNRQIFAEKESKAKKQSGAYY